MILRAKCARCGKPDHPEMMVVYNLGSDRRYCRDALACERRARRIRRAA